MNKKKYIKRTIIIAAIMLIVTGGLVWWHFEKRNSPVELFQSLTNENVEIEMWRYPLTAEEKAECIKVLKKLNNWNVYKAGDTLGTTAEYGYVLKMQDKEYVIDEEYTTYGQGTIYYKGEYWYIKSKELKTLMKEHYEKYKNIDEESK